MNRKVGDYEWRQVSMWEDTPCRCIEKYVEIETGLSGKQTCLFYLQRICEIISDDSWRMENITDLNNVPDNILNWRNSNYKLKKEYQQNSTL